jgi:very-short-patch-repair endonuclease
MSDPIGAGDSQGSEGTARPLSGYVPPLPLPGKVKYRVITANSSKEVMAANMRALPTAHEQLMKLILLQMKVAKEFKEQEVLFGYIADFAHSGFRGASKERCYPFIIEVDGTTHVSEDSRKRDRFRDGVFNRNGIRVLRVTHEAIQGNAKEVKEAVAEWLADGVESSHGKQLVVRRTVLGRRSVRPDAKRNRGAGRGTKG